MTEYMPTVWQDGDAITAEKLNKIENRIEEIQSMERVWTITDEGVEGAVS